MSKPKPIKTMVSPEVYAAALEQAKANGRTVAGWLRVLIEAELKAPTEKRHVPPLPSRW